MDPFGTAQCEASISKAECRTLKENEARSTKTLNRIAAQLRSLAAKLANGAKLSKSDRRLLEVVKDVAGETSGSEEINALADDADAVATGMNDDTKYYARLNNRSEENRAASKYGIPQPNGPWSAAQGERGMGYDPSMPNTIYATSTYFSSDQNAQQRQMVHEFSHPLLGTSDKAYGIAAARELARTSPSTAIQNADNFSFVFYRP
jgi:hypothetical protein